jgi:hypothetical protein
MATKVRTLLPREGTRCQLFFPTTEEGNSSFETAFHVKTTTEAGFKWQVSKLPFRNYKAGPFQSQQKYFLLQNDLDFYM